MQASTPHNALIIADTSIRQDSTWQHIIEYPVDYHENAGYRVQWHWEGGTRNKIWVATNPEGKTSTHRSKYDAMHACEAGIAKRVRSK